MSDRSGDLDRWWKALTDEQRAELLPLAEGDTLPGGHVEGLTRALGSGPAGAGWVESGTYDFYVDDRLAAFLKTKREAE